MERRSSNVQSKETIMEPKLQQEWQETLPAMQLEIEELEERIAPDLAPGLHGYEGIPGNQGGPTHHP